MRKLLELQTSDDIKKSQFIYFIISLLIFSLFLLIRTTEKTLFEIDFFVEAILLFSVLRFYGRALKNKNYALWGIKVVLFGYLFLYIMQYTFVHYNIFILYMSFLGIIFLTINSYIMSSPLYYPRVQWWEYDFRFSGELKANAKISVNEFEVRVADLRRDAVSILAFDILELGKKISVEIPYGSKVFRIEGEIKTQREVIPGRPIRYGILLETNNADKKNEIQELSKVWKLHKKANLRRKFAAQKEVHDV